MGKYKVYYFNVKARAEVIRMLLKAAKIDFEDIRIEEGKWPEYRDKTPTGQAPWVETPDGKTLTQSLAIARMIAHDNNMMGKSGVELYKIEKNIDLITDFKEQVYKMIWNTAEREKMKQDLIKGKGETTLSLIEKDIAENKGFLCIAGKVTLADLYLLTLLDYVKEYIPELMEKHSKLNAYYDNICKACPPVGEWVKTRPVTKM